MEERVSVLFKVLPTPHKLILPTQGRKVLVKLTLKDISIRKRQPSIVECRENPERRVLTLGLNGQQDYIVQNTHREEGCIHDVLVGEVRDLLLEKAEDLRVAALHATVHLPGTQDGEELVLVAVGSDLGIDLETIHDGISHLGGLPDAASYKLSCLHGIGILGVLELRVEGPQEQHHGRETLLAVDDLLLALIILEGDNGSEKVLVVLAVEVVTRVIRKRKVEEVVPERRTLIFAPCVGALVVRNKEVGPLVREQTANSALVDIELGHRVPPVNCNNS